jgi:chaperonin GroES
MSKLIPLGDRLVVRKATEKTSKGGILLPETAREKPQKGEVLAVGPGKRGEDGLINPVAVKVGDVVAFQAWAGSEIKDLGDDILVMREDDVLGVLVEE